MRISRYYPLIGYQKDRETEDEHIRKEYKLGKLNKLKKAEAPEVFRDDFINLDMTVSTDKNQTAVGTGDLVKHWTKDNRNYFRYTVKVYSFSVLLSHQQNTTRKSLIYKGIKMNILYLRKHAENVDHLIRNAKLTLDYCIPKFWAVSFREHHFCRNLLIYQRFCCHSISFCSIHAEDMVFHANIHADKSRMLLMNLPDTSFHISGGATALLIPTNAKALLCLQKRLLCIRK